MKLHSSAIARSGSPSLRSTVFALGLALATHTALACSICRCGDPTFNALGDAVHTTEGVRVALDWDRVAKSQGADDELESVTEHRYTATFLYGATERLLVSARLPYATRSLHATDPEESGSARGLADPEFAVQYRVWSAPMQGDVGSRASIAVQAGVKTAWGENDKRNAEGERFDEHVQPGTGSNDAFIGLSGFYLLDRNSTVFASLQWRDTRRNDAGYRYGRALLANVAYERKVLPRLDSVLELNYRHARRDSTDRDSTLDGNTGGSLLYLSPRLLFAVGGGVVLRFGEQIPVSKSLHGAQSEKTVYNAGLTWGVGRH